MGYRQEQQDLLVSLCFEQQQQNVWQRTAPSTDRAQDFGQSIKKKNHCYTTFIDQSVWDNVPLFFCLKQFYDSIQENVYILL